MTTTAEEAVQEKAFISRVLESLTKPSSEHMATYIGLGLALTIVAGIVFIAMGNSASQKQGEQNLKVTLDDVAKSDSSSKKTTATESSKKVTEKMTAKTQKEEGKKDGCCSGCTDKKETTAKKEKKDEGAAEDGEEDWSDEESEEIDTDNLYKDIDQKGPFLRTVTGTLEPESLLKLRLIIVRYAALAFTERKEELHKERIELLKKNKYN